MHPSFIRFAPLIAPYMHPSFIRCFISTQIRRMMNVIMQMLADLAFNGH